jgi:hypothetical protein
MTVRNRFLMRSDADVDADKKQPPAHRLVKRRALPWNRVLRASNSNF